ncbi:MAG: hypothetical protein LBH19_12305 [Dysgonamonadaceae bacterium]|jgi:hypothetical protein|nr:hypothetical protein [Dysgonamonadaceae bacterium]
MKKPVCYVVSVFLFLLNGCSQYSPEIRQTLEQAGANRPELEKVLEQYAQNPADSLKRRVAEFLIANMPGHYSLNDSALKKHIETSYPGLPKYLTNMMFIGLSENNSSGKIEDIHVISSAFLIKHIDRWLNVWQQTPWGKEIPFDVFCEYILPYRLDCEPLEWIENNDEPAISDTIIHFLRNYNITLRDAAQNLEYITPKPPVELHAVYRSFAKALSDCQGNSYRELVANRQFMIPIYLDFTPHWSQRNGNHTWFGFPDTYAHKRNDLPDPFVTTTKIYRRTYSRNPVPEEDGKNRIPGFFQNPFCKDVTDLYFKTFTVTVPLKKHIPSRYAYLSVFSDLDWQPVAWGKIRGRKAVFTKTGGGAVYLPVYYEGDRELSGGYPFTIDGRGKIISLEPDTNRLIRLHLTRKYPLNLQKLERLESLAGLVIEGSRQKDMRAADTLYVIDKAQHEPFYTHRLYRPTTYRYYRISLPGEPVILLAELCFYDTNRQRLYPLAVIQNGQYSRLDTLVKTEIGQAFDSDYLSSARITGAQAGIVLDFGPLPIEVATIECMPRNDENHIFPGNQYELFYRNAEAWVSLGKKEAVDYSLTYDHVPAGALYWLHNLTKGKEERVFTDENGHIRFW